MQYLIQRVGAIYSICAYNLSNNPSYRNHHGVIGVMQADIASRVVSGSESQHYKYMWHLQVEGMCIPMYLCVFLPEVIKMALIMEASSYLGLPF